MKRVLFVIFNIWSLSVLSQQYDSIPQSNAHFPGGDEAFNEYFQKEYEASKKMKRNCHTGNVFVQFTIETDGSITNVEVVKGTTNACNKEAIRIVEEMPKWSPAIKEGVPRKETIIKPFIFN